MSTRRLTVKIHDVEISKGWASTELRVIEFGEHPHKKEVVIKIEDPSEVGYLRDRLDEIESYWKEQLGIK